MLRELMLVWALSRCAARGEELPLDAASALSLDQFSRSLGDASRRPLRDGYLAVMRALARALALYVPDPRGGEHYEWSKLVAVTESAAPPADGKPLFVLPLDVPSAIFDQKVAHADPLLAAIRTKIYNLAGWELGEAMWIQDDEGDCGLVMQLADGLGLNLGDSGALYVFAGSACMQSH